MDAQSLIKRLGRTYGVTLNPKDAEDCSFAFDEDDVDFELTDRCLNLIADVGVPDYPSRFHKAVLAANLEKQKTLGAFFGVDKNYGNVLLVKNLPNRMDYADFENHIVGFLKVLRHWKKELKRNNEENPTKDAPESRVTDYENLISV